VAAHANPVAWLAVDRDPVRDAIDAEETCNVVIGRVALELVVDVTREGDPAVLDLDVDNVRRDLGVPGQGLQGDAADLVILTTIRADEIDLELVVDVIDTGDRLGVFDRRAALAEALDRAAERDRAVIGAFFPSSPYGSCGAAESTCISIPARSISRSRASNSAPSPAPSPRASPASALPRSTSRSR
jgi:hypothetical protein